MTRRSLLATLSAALAARAPSRAATGTSVIVIGAGLSGLSAARDLVAAGAAVTLLEAQDRMGGRIRTSRLWPDLPMDLGASWIHGTDGNPVTALADAAGAARATTSYDSALALDAEGREVDMSADYELAEALIDTARSGAEDREQDQSLADALRATREWITTDDAQRHRLRHVLSGAIAAEYGGDTDEVSAWYFDESAEFGGEDALFPGGYDQIVRYLAQGLSVRTGAVVTAVARDGDGVRVTLRGGETLRADQVVITVSLGVLKAGAITFDPPLSAQRQDAISTLGMGLLNKCWLRFDRIAWPEDVDWIEWTGPEVGEWAHWVSLAQATGAPVLVAFHAGETARRLETLSDSETMAAARGALTSMFGPDFPAPIDAQVTRWSQDPFTRGAYSFNAVGTTPGTRAALAGTDWDGRIVVAGEAASLDHWGTAHGAVLSGRAAARTLAGQE